MWWTESSLAYQAVHVATRLVPKPCNDRAKAKIKGRMKQRAFELATHKRTTGEVVSTRRFDYVALFHTAIACSISVQIIC